MTYETSYDHSGEMTAKNRAYGKIAALRARIEDGLDGLPDDAKDRVRKAREAAIAAQSEIQDRAESAARAARQTAHENPLLIGALAFAAGAAIAASLPRTSTENQMIGAHRDRLFDEADRVLRVEIEKAKLSAEEVVREGQKHAKKTASETVDKVADAVPSGHGKNTYNDTSTPRQ